MNKKLLFYIIMLLQFVFYNCNLTNFDTFEITFSSPTNNSFNITKNSYVEIEFNNKANKRTVEDHFVLNNGTEQVDGEFEWVSSKKFRYIPADELKNSSRYIVNIPRDVRDSDGNKMEKEFISEFYVGDDLKSPEVITSTPTYTAGGTVIDPLTNTISITFSESMEKLSTEAAFSISPNVTGYYTWSANSTILNYNLTSKLDYGKQYKFTIANTATDLSNNTLSSSYEVIFIPGNDFEYPQVYGIYDGSLAPTPIVADLWATDSINIISKTNTTFAIEFTKEMDRNSAESAFSITPAVSGEFSWNVSNTIMTFIPAANTLTTETNYTVRIDNTAKDINGRKINKSQQVSLLTQTSDSSYIHVGIIYGHCKEGVLDNVLIDEINPVAESYPISIDMGNLIAATTGSRNDDFNFQIVFYKLDDLNNVQIVDIDLFSIFDNISTTKVAGSDSETPITLDLNLSLDKKKLFYNLCSLTNKAEDGTYRSLYRVTIYGGKNGIKDVNGNYLEEDFVFDFQEQE